MTAAKISSNVSLAAYTTFKVGGPADYFIDVCSQADLIEALAWAKQNSVPYFILGSGSNLLVSDRGYSGLAIHLVNQEYQLDPEHLQIKVGAGLALSALLNLSLEQSWSGLVWASGIPGTVGGAIRGNAGAYGSETKDSLISVQVYDLESASFIDLPVTACRFGYRDSLFKASQRYIIWSARFQFQPDDRPALIAASQEIILKRQAKLPPEPSAGSVFKNLPLEDLPQSSARLTQLLSTLDIKGQKVPTAAIIDHLGLGGVQSGFARISDQHSNVIVNLGNATAADILKLIQLVQDQAKTKLNLDLEPEIRLLGF